jgi:hypothetical protein
VHPDETALLASLPATCRAEIVAGFGETNAGRSLTHLTAALESVGYPKVGTPRVFPLASSLTPEQRTVAELLACREQLVEPFALPATRNNFRHWVAEGADDPLRYEVTVDGRSEPLWRAIQMKGASVVLEDVPVGVAIHALALLWKDFGRVWYTHFFEKDDRGRGAFARVHPRLRDEAHPWIAAYADEALDRAKWLSATGGLPGLVRSRPPAWWVPAEVRWLVFLSLVRAHVPIEPRWDVFFPVQGTGSAKLTFECLKAVPEERRAGAILEGLGESGNHAYDVPVAVRLLEKVPSAELARWIVANAGNAAGMTRREVMAAVAKVKSENTRAVHANAAAGRRTVKLRYRKLVGRPGASDLTSIQRSQVELAGKEYDALDLPASERLAGDATGDVALFRRFLEVGELAGEDGKVVFDVLLFMADSGAIFHTGTTRLAASIVQDGVDCGDEDLCDGIEQALADRVRRARARKPPKKRAKNVTARPKKRARSRN